MRHFLTALICVFILPAVTQAGPGAVRCGKLLDVRTGKILIDQPLCFDDSGTIKPPSTPFLPRRSQAASWPLIFRTPRVSPGSD